MKCCGEGRVAHLFVWLSGGSLRACHRLCARLCVRIVRHRFGELLLLLDLLACLGTDLAKASPPLGCRLVAAAGDGVASSVRDFATATRISADRSALAFLTLTLSWAAAKGTASVISVAASS